MFLTTACVDEPPSPRSDRFPLLGSVPAQGGDAPSAVAAPPPGGDASAGRAVLRRGSGQLVGVARPDAGSAPADAALAPGGPVEVNLFGASLGAAASEVLGAALGLPFVIEEGLEASVTIQTTGPVPRAALLDLFRAALEIDGISLSVRDGVWRISAASEIQRSLAVSRQAGFTRPAVVIAPLRFVSAEQVIPLLEPIVGDDLVVRADRQRNILLLSGGPDSINKALDALNLFDIDLLRGKSVASIPVEFAEASALAEELVAVFDTGEGGALSGVVDFVPNDRLGTVLVISTQPRYVDEARGWIRDLDRAARRDRPFSRIYRLQNRRADELASVLSRLMGAEQADGAPEGGATDDGATLAAIDVSLEAGGASVDIVPDDARNAIVVRGVAADHEEVLKLIADLDTNPHQVLLESTIVEVTLNDELQLGVRWFFESGNFSARFTDFASGAVAGLAPGFSALFSAGGARVAISALQSVTDVKVISTPTVLVVDNGEAILRIGDQVPIATQSAVDVSDPNAPIVNTIDYRDTGIILSIRPRIGDTRRIALDIDQEASDVVATTTSGIDSPTIRQRRVKTSVMVDDGATLALGGLIQESSSSTRTQVPLLGDIPVVGELFKTRDNITERTELLVLITPRVVRDAAEAQRVSDAWRAGFERLEGPLDRGVAGGRHILSRPDR